MANISATITAVDSPTTGWYKAKIATNPSVEVSAVSLKATKMSLGQQVGVIEYRDWDASPEFGFVELGGKQSLVYVAPAMKSQVIKQNPANTTLAWIANFVGNKRMLYHPATVTGVNSSTLNVTDRVTSQQLLLNVSNVSANDFVVGNGCLIELSSTNVIGFWLSVPDYVIPTPGDIQPGKSPQVGYNMERNFIIFPIQSSFTVKFGSYISYKTTSGYYVWDSINETSYQSPADPKGDGWFLHYPTITMASPTSKYIYTEMKNAVMDYCFRRRFNRETQSFEDNGGTLIVAFARSYHDSDYTLLLNGSGIWVLCDWDGTNPVDVDAIFTAFGTSITTAGGSIDSDSARLFVMDDQPIFITKVDIGVSYALYAVNLKNGATYSSATYSTGGVGAWTNDGHVDPKLDRYYFYAGGYRIRIDPTSLGTQGTWADNLPIPFSRVSRSFSASSGKTQPEGDEYEPWWAGQVLRDGVWLECFPVDSGSFYYTAPKENFIYSAY